MIPTAEFHHALSIAVAHVSATLELPNLQNIFLSFQPDNRLTLIGTDGHRLAAIDLCVPHGQPDGTTFHLYIEYARKLLKTFKAGADTRLTVALFGPEIMFTDGVACESYPAPETPGDVPDWRSILGWAATASPAGGELRIDSGYITDALAACKPLMRTDYPTVRLRVADNTPLFMLPELRNGLEAVRGVTIAIMYKGALQ